METRRLLWCGRPPQFPETKPLNNTWSFHIYSQAASYSSFEIKKNSKLWKSQPAHADELRGEKLSDATVHPGNCNISSSPLGKYIKQSEELSVLIITSEL